MPKSRSLIALLAVACLAGSPGLAQDGAELKDGAAAPPAQPATPQPLTVQVEPTPAPQHDPAAIAVLDAAEAAIDALESFRCDLECVGHQVFQTIGERGTIRVIGRRSPSDRSVWQLRFTGPIMPDRAQDPEERIDIDATFDGQRMRYTDHEEQVIGARVLPVRILRPWFTAPLALRDDRLRLIGIPAEFLNAQKISLQPRQTLDGVECDVLRADVSDLQYFQLFVGVQDHLPRRWVLGLEPNPTLPMSGWQRANYKNLEVNPDITDADLAIPVPEGWTEQRFPDQVVTPPVITDPGDLARAREQGFEGDGSSGEDEAAMLESGEDSSGPGPARPAATTHAQDFTLKDAAGTDLRLSGLRGQPVVLVFWGSWNPWARDLLAQVAPIVADTGDARLLVLAVRERSRDGAVQRHQQQGAPGTLLLAADEVAAQYQVAALPTVVVVGPDGRILLQESGFAPDSDLPERLADVLRAP